MKVMTGVKAGPAMDDFLAALEKKKIQERNSRLGTRASWGPATSKPKNIVYQPPVEEESFPIQVD